MRTMLINKPNYISTSHLVKLCNKKNIQIYHEKNIRM